MTSSADEERKLFEEWLETETIAEHSNWFTLDANGDYEIGFVDWAWRSWMARSRL